MSYKYKKNTFQVAIEILPISCQNDLETQEGTKGVKNPKKFPGGAHPQTPLEACASVLI